jgi:hypothetical protein
MKTDDVHQNMRDVSPVFRIVSTETPKRRRRSTTFFACPSTRRRPRLYSPSPVIRSISAATHTRSIPPAPLLGLGPGRTPRGARMVPLRSCSPTDAEAVDGSCAEEVAVATRLIASPRSTSRLTYLPPREAHVARAPATYRRGGLIRRQCSLGRELPGGSPLGQPLVRVGPARSTLPELSPCRVECTGFRGKPGHSHDRPLPLVDVGWINAARRPVPRPGSD